MTKHRFTFLDFLRGIAALSVAALHACEGFNFHYIPAHAYLAVDFFFCLSGFVIAHAYDSRIGAGMGFADFARRRLTRLYPMIFIATVGAALTSCFFPITPQPLLLIAAAFLMLPAALLFHLQAFPLDGPLWSLFFEFAANTIFFLETKAARRSLLKYVVYLTCFGLFLFLIIYQVGSIEPVGFCSWQSFLAGFSRVAYSFLAGVLICRFRLTQFVPSLPPSTLACLLILLLFCPAIGNTWIYDSAAIICVFPVLVTLGANAADTGKFAKFWSFCGNLSYPLYVIHEVVFRGLYDIFHNGYFYHVHPAWFIILSLILAVLLSYLLLAIYDRPLRRFLSRADAPPQPGDLRLA